MPTAHATVATTRPGRYLTQLCRHVDHLSRHTDSPQHLRRGEPGHTPPGPDTRVTWTDTAGTIDLGWGRCTLTADDNGLVLQAEAADAADLHRLQGLLSARLEQFGRRDQLTVTWQPTATPEPAASAGGAHDVPHAGRRRPHHRTVGLVILGVLVVALHIALGAAVVAVPWWTTPALDVVLAAIVVKLLVSVVLGRRVIHHRRRPTAATPETTEQPRP